MATNHRLSFTPNLVVGCSIMLLGLVLILDRLGLVQARELLRFWPVLLIVFGASVVVQALGGGAAGATSPDSRDGQTDTLPLVALLVVVFLFVSYVEGRRAREPGSAAAGTASVFAMMGRDEQTAPAHPFRGGEMTTIMGRTHLDLRQAIMAPGEEAVIDVLGLMGRLVVLVPDDWVVDVQTMSVMGGVRNDRSRRAAREDQPTPTVSDALERPDPPIETRRPPRVVLRGFVVMGALVIAS